MNSISNKININTISAALLGLLLFSSYVGNIIPFKIKMLSLGYLSVFAIAAFLVVILNRLKIKNSLATELIFAIVFLIPLISNIANGGDVGQYFSIHSKMAIYSIFTYYLLKLLLPFVNIQSIEKSILVSGYLGCFISLYFYILNFGNYSTINQFGCCRGVRLTGAIGDDPNIAMYSLVVFNALCMTKKSKLYLFGWILSSIVIILSMSRGAILAMTFAFLVSYFIKSQKIIRIYQIKLLSPFLLFMIFLLYSINPVITVLINRFSYDKLSDGAGRTKIWSDAFNTFQNNSYIGIGFGNTVNYNKKYYNSHFINHCSFLDYLVEGGLINAYLFVFLHFWIFYRILSNPLIISKYPFIFIAFVMFTIISMFLSGGLLRAPFAIFMALLERFSKNANIDVYTMEAK